MTNETVACLVGIKRRRRTKRSEQEKRTEAMICNAMRSINDAKILKMNAPDLQQFCARSDAQSADVVEDYEMWKGG